MQLKLHPGTPGKLLHSCGMHLHTNLIAHVLTYAACPPRLPTTWQFGDPGEAHS